MFLDWSFAESDPPLHFHGHIHSAGKLTVDIVDGHGAGLVCYQGDQVEFLERAGRQVASTSTWLRKGQVPPHEVRRIRALVAAIPTAVKAKVFVDGGWREV
jgi:hypothetical protein